MGASKKAPFDIDGATARGWLALPNPHRQSNAHLCHDTTITIDIRLNMDSSRGINPVAASAASGRVTEILAMSIRTAFPSSLTSAG